MNTELHLEAVEKMARTKGADGRMNKSTERLIKKEFLDALKSYDRTTLMTRYTMGRCVIALQTLHGDCIAGNVSRPSYKRAMKTMIKWASGAGREMNETILSKCHYVANRMSQSRIKMVADKGMTFTQVYDMLEHYSKDKKGLTDCIGRIKDGTLKDYRQFGRFKEHKTTRYLKGVDVGTNKNNDVVANITIRGDETEEDFENYLLCILSAAIRARVNVDSIVEKSLSHVQHLRKKTA